MGKVTKRLEHDWVMVTARFGDGKEAKAKWSRNGSSVTVTPRDAASAKTLSLIVDQAARLPGMNIGKVADGMEKAGTAASDIGEFLDLLKGDFGVTGEMPKPAADGPAETQATIRKSRGWEVAATFPSGETFSLKINKSSVGYSSKPAVASRDNDIMNLVFSIKQIGSLDDEELANRIKEAAEASADMDSWIEEVRGILAPRPAR